MFVQGPRFENYCPMKCWTGSLQLLVTVSASPCMQRGACPTVENAHLIPSICWSTLSYVLCSSIPSSVMRYT